MKTKHKELFRLPNGESTYDVNVYAKAWTKLGKILEDNYDLETIGYDPEVLTRKKGPEYSRAIDLPTWLVHKLIEVAIFTGQKDIKGNNINIGDKIRLVIDGGKYPDRIVTVVFEDGAVRAGENSDDILTKNFISEYEVTKI